MPLTKKIATKLKDQLLEHRCLSDEHSLPTADLVQRIVQDAGLGVAFVPLKEGNRWFMHLAVVDPGKEDEVPWLVIAPLTEHADKVYALIKLLPMTEFAGDLDTMNLSRLWWAAPHAFAALARAIAPAWNGCESGGRAGWGTQRRAALVAEFDGYWEHSEVVEPGITINPARTRFDGFPVLINDNLSLPASPGGVQ